MTVDPIQEIMDPPTLEDRIELLKELADKVEAQLQWMEGSTMEMPDQGSVTHVRLEWYIARMSFMFGKEWLVESEIGWNMNLLQMLEEHIAEAAPEDRQAGMVAVEAEAEQAEEEESSMDDHDEHSV